MPPPWKMFQTEMSFTAFSKKINVFLRLQNTIKISNVTLFTSAQRQLCVLLFVKKAAIFLRHQLLLSFGQNQSKL